MMESLNRIVRLLGMLLLAAILAQPAQAQIWKKAKDAAEKRIKERTEQKAEDEAVKAVDKAADKAFDSAKDEADQAAASARPRGGSNMSSGGGAGSALGAALGAALGGGGGNYAVVDFRDLKALLPSSAGGLSRTEATGEMNSAFGFSMSTASASYGSGEETMEIKISDMGGINSFGMLGYAWMNQEVESESDTGYERTGKYGEYPSHEQFENSGDYQNGTYQVVVGERFLVEVQGNNLSMDRIRDGISGVDLSKLDAMKTQGENEAFEPVDFQTLKALLPGSLAGMSRSNANGQKSSALGIKTSYAEGQYSSGSSSITLKITDFGTMQSWAALGYGWLAAEVESESDTGYEKSGKYEGYPSHEKFNKQGESSSASMEVVVDGRFMVSADGNDVSMDQVRGAIAQVNLSSLHALKPAE